MEDDATTAISETKKRAAFVRGCWLLSCPSGLVWWVKMCGPVCCFREHLIRSTKAAVKCTEAPPETPDGVLGLKEVEIFVRRTESRNSVVHSECSGDSEKGRLLVSHTHDFLNAFCDFLNDR
eukprot:scaffold2620_cov143-Skeletonema_menzelii.AAC.19